ncbi:MAG TPA: response regulator [Paludibacteraceae bacterium]|nr:response regulator [Paludibacteraceae bacterium]
MDKPAILYVDDEIINLKLLEANLEKKYHVLLAPSGAHGLEMLESRNDVQVVISDMKMPGMSGLEFILKAREKFPSLYYYLMTGFDVSADIQEALSRGQIVTCFTKPVSMGVIDTEIKKVIRE